MSLLPLRGESSAEPDEPQVLGLDGEEADEAFDVLSSSTTRTVLSQIYDQPATPAEIRDEIGTSLQNVHYHLDKLEDADLIEPAGTGYSEKGTEMTIYAPANEAVVMFAGRESDQSSVKQLLGQVLGVVFALSAATLLFDRYLFRTSDPTTETGGRIGTADTEGPSTTTATESGRGGLDAVVGDAVNVVSEPTVAFLVGGLFVLVVLGVMWYVSR